MLYEDIIAIRNRCATEAEKAEIDAAVDTIGDTFMEMVKSFENSFVSGKKEPADLSKARRALEIIRAKDVEKVLPEFESDSALAIFIIKFAREVMGN